MLNALLVALLLGPAVLTTSQNTQQDPPLTDQDVEDAIDAGLADPVQLVKLLRTSASYRTERSPVGVFVYSPRMLIGIAARAAREQGRQLSVSGVPRSWRERLAYMAVRSMVNEYQGRRMVIDREAKVIIASKPQHVRQMMEDGGIKPRWLSFDPKGVLATFGADLPDPDVAAVAAFPISVFQADLIVLAYRTVEGWTAVWASTMFAEDVAALSK